MRAALAFAVLALAACATDATTDDPDDTDGVTELDQGGPLGKEDSAGIAGLPVAGDYAATQAWVVKNQWEDTTTPDAKLAGMAWPANSGLDWDQKFAAWVGSFEQIPSLTWFTTIKISTPFGKTVPGPKVDCADFALLLRISFAAWYHLPIYLVGWDGNTPVYFGHFGVRTAAGQWSRAPAFAQYKDYSTETPAQYGASWPKDTVLRTRGVSASDDISDLFGPGSREGAFLDEIHLNKRAARLVLFAQAYLGSHNMVDSRNTYNIVPEALHTGDVLMFARSKTVDGHTTIVTRVKQIAAGSMQAESVYGNDPPAQPQWQDPGSTRSLFTDNEGGGPVLNTPYGGTTLYSHLNGGIKRFRVAKVKNGAWFNTWMNADEASWINDTDYDKIGARPATFGKLLGDPDPNVQRDQLLSVIAEKRTYLMDHPSSCAARSGREDAFAALYTLMATSFGMTKTQVDQQYRAIDDYIFAPLDYSKSRTCCWNHTNRKMYDVISAYVAAQNVSACTAPAVFKLTANSYDPFASYATTTGHATDWAPWSADEECLQASATDDVVLPPDITPWCSLTH